MAHHVKINKAVAAADLLYLQFPELTEKIKVVEDYLKSLRYILDQTCLNIVISCVDNLKSRNLQITDILNSNDRTNTLYITPGNELSDGQVVSFLKFNGQLFGDNPLEQWESWAKPTDRIPRKGSCIDHSLSTPQLLATNMMAAQITLNTIVNFFHNGELNTCTIFDVFKNSAKVIDTVKLFSNLEENN